MTTDKFHFTIGVTPGYFHNNENENIDFVKLVDECARRVEEATGIYISFNIIPIITLYKTEWGCPEGGEKTYLLSAIRNPKFNNNKDAWEGSCLNVADILKKELGQSSVTCEFDRVDLWYLNE